MTEEAKTTGEKLLALIPGIIKNDFPRKFIALSFSLLVYFTVQAKIGVESVVDNVNVRVKMPASLIMLDDRTPKVSVRIKGNERKIKQVSPSNLEIEVAVDETRFIPGEPYTLAILPSNVKTDIDGVSIVDVKPSQLTLDIDRTKTRTVQVRPKFTPGAKLPDGYTTGKITMNPPECRLTGPVSIVDRIEYLTTDPIPVDNTTSESFEYKCTIALNHKAIKISPSEVIAQVEIIKEFENRLYRAVPIRLLMPPEEKNLTAELITSPHTDITITGLKTTVEIMKKDELKAYIDVSQFEQPGVYSVDISYWVDRQGVSVQNIFPPSVQVKMIRR